VRGEDKAVPVPTAPKNLKDLTQTAIANVDRPLLHSVWHEVDYRLDVCRATNGAHVELT
jgi:hypothetical protein